ncbi:Uncharacterised protein [Mycobacteroides abscessus subsp. abscessus]|nr:Uncharacterised protein [Mycobacteroides abscessus subsp. abscessus]
MLETCTIGSRPRSTAAPSTLRVPSRLMAIIRSASAGSVLTMAALCTTASHPSSAASTDARSVISPTA